MAVESLTITPGMLSDRLLGRRWAGKSLPHKGCINSDISYSSNLVKAFSEHTVNFIIDLLGLNFTKFGLDPKLPLQHLL